MYLHLHLYSIYVNFLEFVNAVTMNRDMCDVILGSVIAVLSEFKQQLLNPKERPTSKKADNHH